MGQLCLLVALVCSGYAAFVSLACGKRPSSLLSRTGSTCGVVTLLALSGALLLLVRALVSRDFSLDYPAQYSSRLLPWYYSLAALWAGQAGSLLLWAWILAVLAILFRFLPAADVGLRDSAFAVLMAALLFLVAVMVFAADPLKANLLARTEGLGLSPLLQHPAMLAHPPVVFFAYAAWTVPCALAIAALVRGRLDATWAGMARPWALLGWTSLLAGLLLGAYWAYQELGWGGYWGWDPVENGSLLPWLTGTAFLHCLMAWRSRDCLKKLALALAILTFGLCHLATFLTRSGIFGSVHAFGESQVGWAFLGSTSLLLGGGLGLIVRQRGVLGPQRAARSLLAREMVILVSTFLLLLLALVVMAGTLVGPLSYLVLGRRVVVEAPFYTNVLIPLALLLLLATAAAPLLRWEAGPGPVQVRLLICCLFVGVASAAVGYWLGSRSPLSLGITGLAAVAAAALGGEILHDARQRGGRNLADGLVRALSGNTRRYAGYTAHFGFVLLAIGITGSGQGSRRTDVLLREGETFTWAERQVRYVRLEQQERTDRLIAEAVLEVTDNGGSPVVLRPSRHLHLLPNEWQTVVDVHSTWRSDFYTVLNAGLGDGRVALTLVENPMMRWLWLGGWVAALGALAALVPRGALARRRAAVGPRASTRLGRAA